MPETLTDRQAEELRFGICELEKKLEHYETRLVDQECIQENELRQLVDQINGRDEIIASMHRSIEEQKVKHAAEMAQLKASLY